MIHSTLLKRLEGLRHGFGTRHDHRPKNVVTVQQVHGVRILEPVDIPPSEPDGYDVVLVDRPGLAVAVKTADCQPILLAEPRRRVVAAVHAGWKSTLLRVTQVAVRRLMEKGARVEEMVCALGPNIAGVCFEVEEDVARDFEKEFPDWPILTRVSETKWLLDVAKANRLQLLEIGVSEARIERIDLCTHCRDDLFWSYRRDGEKAGRMISFIELL